ncbi:DUF6456 domain-containing protein [Roseovarius aestuariivivens]|uniref:DUF6456 domain-containing protein n=1 Tax=Roseovarius aestuariivivens TaxID=1888910 RepID=UPI001FD9F6F7|nr:DUF6456 domain-containing protein [Roseovarius aestuariivivens]
MQKGFLSDETSSGAMGWVPRAALNYLAHTEGGTSIRALARKAGCHASTVSRQVRAFEARRDDLLVDEALRRLGKQVAEIAGTGSPTKETPMPCSPDRPDTAENALTKTRLHTEARRVLRRLCESGALLAVAADMDKAVVLREQPHGSSRTAIVDRDVAEAMALKGWITCDAPGRVSRYRISGAGRTALAHLLAEVENELQARKGREPAPALFDDEEEETAARPRMRYGAPESPLVCLARRRDRDGARFLSDELVRAGERLREDFEIAQMGPRTGQSWDEFLSDATPLPVPDSRARSEAAARARVTGALRDLGPGLGDVVLRCCCYLEGLETAEKKMGWSARSGKIVLRIALQRLKRHYDALGDAAGLMG